MRGSVGARWAAGLFAILICFGNLAPARPLCNWDLIGYTAAAWESAGLRGAELHTRAYEDVHAVCPAEYATLTEANEYRRAVAADPAALSTQLPFYRVKVLYAGAVGLVARSGGSPAAAAIRIGQAGYLATAFVMALWLADILPAVGAALLAWLFLSIPGMLELGRLATPDSVSVALLLASAWLALRAGRPRVGLAVAVASVWVRPDDVLWLGLLGVLLAGRERALRGPVATALALGAISYVAIAKISGSYGWSTQIHQEFVARVAVLPEGGAGIRLIEYPLVLLKASHPAHLPQLLLPIVLVGAGTMLLRPRLGAEEQGEGVLELALAFIALHWVLYPAQDRFLVAAYLAILVSAAELVASARYDRCARPAPAGSSNSRPLSST